MKSVGKKESESDETEEFGVEQYSMLVRAQQESWTHKSLIT